MIKNPQQLYDSSFRIAGITVSIRFPKPLEIGEPFREFYLEGVNGESCQFQAVFQEMEQLPEIVGKLFYEDPMFSVYETIEGKKIRCYREYYHAEKIDTISIYEESEQKVFVSYLRERKEPVKTIFQAFYYIGWEQMLFQKERVFLHGSFLKTEFGGIVFSGPSGIGKSTQADLWIRSGLGTLLNGDKVILYQEQDTWQGAGSPYAGSSNCYKNEICPIEGIFFLKWGDACKIRSLEPPEAFKQVYGNLTVNRWNESFVRGCCDLVQKMIFQIPMYEFTCTPNQSSVKYLWEYLQRRNKSWK